ncbi:unnamed protein product [Rhodiola kirilowii]
MVSAKVKIEWFDGKTDFGLWRQRMKAILVQIKVAKALTGTFPEPTTAEEKADALELAYSTLILHLSDKVLREVSKETTAAGVWLKLEQLYMTKTLTNRIYLKRKLFGFKMDSSKSIEEHLDDFSKIIIDLENIEEKIADGDQAIMILNSLPSSYSTLVETMKYSKDTLTLEEVLVALKQKQIEAKASGEAADGLVAQGKFHKNPSQKKFNKSKSQPK